jgi:hypothetical protein
MTSGVHIGGYHKNGNKNQHDNFCQKTGHFCKPINRVSFEKIIKNLERKNNCLITNS